MAGKLTRRKKPYNPVKDSPIRDIGELHDRRAREEDLLRNARVAPMDVIDPYGLNPGDKIQVLRSLRNDTLAQMHARKHIDDAQYQAGRDYQRDSERSRSEIMAVDPSKEFVDGGLVQGLSEARMEATDRLNVANEELGRFGAILTGEVLMDLLTMEEVANRRGLAGQKWQEYFGKRFRECLETLALVYGHTTKTKKVLDIVD